VSGVVRAHTIVPGRPGAPLVVLAHGLEDTCHTWSLLVAELDPSWRLVALDLPWRAGNDYRWWDRQPGDWLGEALDLLDARPDLLIAHSFSGNAALNLLCARDPRPGSAVALLCPLYRQPHTPVTWEMFERARTAFVTHVRAGVHARMGARGDTIDPAVLDKMMNMALDRVGPSGFIAVLRQFIASADLLLGSIAVPTLVVAGGADPTLSPRAALALSGAIPGAQARVNEGYDHFCHVRHAAGIAADIIDFTAAHMPVATAKEFR
jgi:pimeloyl-ACP methyl ester carboxylesterase